MKSVAAGMNPMDLKRGIDLAVGKVVEDLKKRSDDVKGSQEIAQVGIISANGDREVGEKIAEAMEKVGKEGVITVEEAKGLEFELDVVEGMDIEVVPGILPVSNVATTRRFAAQCGATIPDWLDSLFEGLDDLPAARQLIAATVASELAGQLYAGGVRHFHFYTLNRAELSYAICHLLGVRPKAWAWRSALRC